MCMYVHIAHTSTRTITFSSSDLHYRTNRKLLYYIVFTLTGLLNSVTESEILQSNHMLIELTGKQCLYAFVKPPLRMMATMVNDAKRLVSTPSKPEARRNVNLKIRRKSTFYLREAIVPSTVH